MGKRRWQLICLVLYHLGFPWCQRVQWHSGELSNIQIKARESSWLSAASERLISRHLCYQPSSYAPFTGTYSRECAGQAGTFLVPKLLTQLVTNAVPRGNCPPTCLPGTTEGNSRLLKWCEMTLSHSCVFFLVIALILIKILKYWSYFHEPELHFKC